MEQFAEGESTREEIRNKLRQNFDGKIVRKDLTKKIKEGANVPVYVLEFLLGQYCSSDDETVIEKGVQNVKRILADNFVRPDESQKILSQLRKKGSHTIIDMVTVRLDMKKDCFFAEFSNLGVGESGSGKSTASKLLMGMYLPEKGTVYVNGVSLVDLSLNWLRERTAYVPQTTALFSGSIRENLVMGLATDKMPTDEEIISVLRACCCDFVLDMPSGIDAMLEENGINLSGGQRQRLALCRAILRRPELLVLDEATSALDTVTEFRIQKELRNLLPNAIVIMVAHRQSTITDCDRILVIDHGHVIEEGSHDELLRFSGNYANMWDKQNHCA